MTNLILHQNSKNNQQARRLMLDNLLYAAGYTTTRRSGLMLIVPAIPQYAAKLTIRGEAAGHAN